MGADRIVNLDIALKISSYKSLCCIYDNIYDYTELITSLINKGLDLNERIFYSGDSENTNIILHHLSSRGLNVDALIANGRLAINMYELKKKSNGITGSGDILDLIDNEMEKVSSYGLNGLKVIGEMSFARACNFNSSKIIDHAFKIESYINMNSGCSVYTFFNKNIFSPSIILDILLTQKLLSIGTVFFENFKFLPKEELIKSKRDKLLLELLIDNLKDSNYSTDFLKHNNG